MWAIRDEQVWGEANAGWCVSVWQAEAGVKQQLVTRALWLKAGCTLPRCADVGVCMSIDRIAHRACPRPIIWHHAALIGQEIADVLLLQVRHLAVTAGHAIPIA